MSPWIFIALAVISNVVLNFCLKVVSGLLIPDAPGALAMRVLSAQATWLGVLSALVLVGSFALTLKSFPLSVSYTVITSLAMVSLAVAAIATGLESFSLLRMLGIALVISGVVVIGFSTAAPSAKG